MAALAKGVVFDIQEFCVHDGPGARTTVFLKGCAMACRWCHNPEGLRPEPELMRSAACKGCGACAKAPGLLEAGRTQDVKRLCPHGFLKVAGGVYEAAALAESLRAYADSFALMDGGVSISGGECLLQSAFTEELLRGLAGIHRVVETAGHVPEADFLRVLPHTELVLFDVKLMDAGAHKYWTGVDNAQIQHNLGLLMRSGRPFIARIPLIPGVNDGAENLKRTAERLAPARGRGLVRVEILPYNRAAGAKYAQLGRSYNPGLPTAGMEAPRTENAAVFAEYGIEYEVLGWTGASKA